MTNLKVVAKQEKKTEIKTLLTRNEVVKMLSISISTLSRWQKENILPYSTIGKRVYFDLEDINNLLQSNKVS